MSLRRELEENEYQISNMKSTFLKKNFPIIVTYSLRDEVIAIIKGEKELKI